MANCPDCGVKHNLDVFLGPQYKTCKSCNGKMTKALEGLLKNRPNVEPTLHEDATLDEMVCFNPYKSGGKWFTNISVWGDGKRVGIIGVSRETLEAVLKKMDAADAKAK